MNYNEKYIGGQSKGALNSNCYKINIKHLRKSYTTLVTAETTINDLKTIILKRDGVPIDQQRIVFGTPQKNLDNNTTLRENNILDGNYVYIILRLKPFGGTKNLELIKQYGGDPIDLSGPCFQIKIDSNGSFWTASVTNITTIGELKRLLFKKEGIPIDRIIFEYGNRILENDETLLQNSILADSTINYRIDPIQIKDKQIDPPLLSISIMPSLKNNIQSEIYGGYKEKYLKYKQKYLQLKNDLN